MACMTRRHHSASIGTYQKPSNSGIYHAFDRERLNKFARFLALEKLFDASFELQNVRTYNVQTYVHTHVGRDSDAA
jgi:hypothetical protein